MEDIILNIDSRYRNIILYPNECKFKLNLIKSYKNIISLKLLSLELNNNIKFFNYKNINSSKNNNWITLHIPNTLNDPDGIKIYLLDNYTRTIDAIKNNINNQLNIFINNMYSYEKYYYFFYLYSSTTITIISSSISNNLILNIGWYSLYGLYNIIYNFINNLNLLTFIISPFTLYIFDRRYPGNTRPDLIILPTIILTTLKNDLYSIYVQNSTTYQIIAGNSGILDGLLNEFGSIYYTSSTNIAPINYQLFNLNLSIDIDSLKVLFINSLNNLYSINTTGIFTQFTLSNPPSIQDTLTYGINFTTLPSTYQDTILDITTLNYPSVGYMLGFRWVGNSSIINSNFINNSNIILGTDIYNIYNENYIFLKINDWGSIDFFNKSLLSKINFSNCIHNNKIDDYIYEEYKLRQPINIQKLDIELIDYLGNTFDLNGSEFSFTLKLCQIFDVYEKKNIETTDLVFKKK